MGSINNKKELYEWYSNAKIFCMTSRWEGFSLSFIEALYFGNYILSTNVSGINDVINWGKTGKIIKNAEDLEFALSKLVSDDSLLEEKFANIIEHAKQFSWKNILTSLDNEIKKKIKLVRINDIFRALGINPALIIFSLRGLFPF